VLAILCVGLSLALFALGGADQSGGFRLGTLSSSRPTTVMGLVLVTVVVSCAVVVGYDV
jgi:hypothetical protein